MLQAWYKADSVLCKKLEHFHALCLARARSSADCRLLSLRNSQARLFCKWRIASIAFGLGFLEGYCTARSCDCRALQQQQIVLKRPDHKQNSPAAYHSVQIQDFLKLCRRLQQSIELEVRSSHSKTLGTGGCSTPCMRSLERWSRLETNSCRLQKARRSAFDND